MNPTIILTAPERPEQIQLLANMKKDCEDESGYDPFFVGDSDWWLVYDIEKVVGFAGIHSVDWRTRVCRLSGPYILPVFRKHGYGAVVLKEVLRLVFDQLNLRKMEALVEQNNDKMLSLVEKNRAFKEGGWKDRGYYNGNYHSYIQWAWFKKEE